MLNSHAGLAFEGQRLTAQLGSSHKARCSVTARDREGRSYYSAGVSSDRVNDGNKYIRFTCQPLPLHPFHPSLSAAPSTQLRAFPAGCQDTANVHILPLGERMHTKLSRFLMALVLTTLCLASCAAARGITEAPSVITPAPEALCTLTNSIPSCGVSLKHVDLSFGC